MVDAWRFKKDRPNDFVRLPVKTVKYNRCPAVAPLGVIKDEAIQARLDLPIKRINEYLGYLRQHQTEFTQKVLQAIEILDAERSERYPKLTTITDQNVDSMLYDGFINGGDKPIMQTIRVSEPTAITKVATKLRDARLQQLVPLYKARNFPAALDGEERQTWETHVTNQLFEGGQQSRLSKYFHRLQELSANKLSSRQAYIVEELRLYGESIMPSDITEQ